MENESLISIKEESGMNVHCSQSGRNFVSSILCIFAAMLFLPFMSIAYAEDEPIVVLPGIRIFDHSIDGRDVYFAGNSGEADSTVKLSVWNEANNQIKEIDIKPADHDVNGTYYQLLSVSQKSALLIRFQVKILNDRTFTTQDLEEIDFTSMERKKIASYDPNETFFSLKDSFLMIYQNDESDAQSTRFVLTNYDNNIIWEKTYLSKLTINDVISVPDGFVVLGAMNGCGYISKFDANGEMIWEKLIENCETIRKGKLNEDVIIFTGITEHNSLNNPCELSLGQISSDGNIDLMELDEKIYMVNLLAMENVDNNLFLLLLAKKGDNFLIEAIQLDHNLGYINHKTVVENADPVCTAQFVLINSNLYIAYSGATPMKTDRGYFKFRTPFSTYIYPYTSFDLKE